MSTAFPHRTCLWTLAPRRSKERGTAPSIHREISHGTNDKGLLLLTVPSRPRSFMRMHGETGDVYVLMETHGALSLSGLTPQGDFKENVIFGTNRSTLERSRPLLSRVWGGGHRHKAEGTPTKRTKIWRYRIPEVTGDKPYTRYYLYKEGFSSSGLHL